MALDLHQQFTSLLSQKKHVLITTKRHPSNDAIASALALALFLDTLDIRSDIVIDGYIPKKELQFLSRANSITPALSYLKKFILNIDIRESGIKDLSYDTTEDALRIFVTPKQGILTKDNITTSDTTYRYDTIVVLDSDDLPSLGKVFEQNTELFYETPVINISKSASNEQFGHINIVDVTATAIAEILYGIFVSIGKEHVSENIAMALLTGMMSRTRSFSGREVTPKALNIASKLIRLGADRETIVTQLFQTRTIASLKLWGVALSNLQSEKDKKLVWTTITQDAFISSGASEDDLYELVPELIGTSPEAEVIAIIHEHPQSNDIHGLIYSKKWIDSRTLVKNFEPIGSPDQVTILLSNTTLGAATTSILESIRSVILHKKNPRESESS